MNKQDELYDKRTRWQETRIKQFSYVNYLVLTLTLATLGFAVSLVVENDSFRTEPCTLLFWLHLLSLIGFVVSIILGIWCSYIRLKDFRKTSKTTRLKYVSRGIATPKTEKLKTKTKKLGKQSWYLLQGQIFAFGAGFLLLLATIAVWRFNIL